MIPSGSTPHFISPPTITPSIHIHPNLSATQLGLIPKDLKPILQHQQEHLLDEYAQPPLTDLNKTDYTPRLVG
jgi:hypothetical protein